MRLSVRASRLAAIALPIAMAGASVIAFAPTASATSYSGENITQLMKSCDSQGNRPSPVSGFNGEEIPSTTVQYGFNGVCGAAVQALLDIWGPPCATNGGTDELQIDGQDGPLTNSAVICMQQSQGLQDNGQVGPITWTWLLTSIGG